MIPPDASQTSHTWSESDFSLHCPSSGQPSPSDATPVRHFPAAPLPAACGASSRVPAPPPCPCSAPPSRIAPPLLSDSDLRRPQAERHYRPLTHSRALPRWSRSSAGPSFASLHSSEASEHRHSTS
ncbi:hypothetical protein PVAP13_3NG070906 [Panicum virgatum]|uniref:Uncharacterized protein n=1 Tax=Panicum virgatum TaxID=38727 RepID=A0A8T0U5A4_PANVG|nr:hypothetical protein PVAP13_3NG070906 [Panicum virgatum]